MQAPQIPVGETVEFTTVRIHRFANCFEVTDLANAGKRGKKVRQMSLAPSHIYRRNTPEAWLEQMAKVLLDYPSYDAIVALISDLLVDFPGEIRMTERLTRGVDVLPAGTVKLSLTTDTGLEITATPAEFRVLHRAYFGKEQELCQETFYRDANKRAAKAFYGWLKTHLSTVNGMGIGELRAALSAEGIAYDYH